ncbi:5-formyltetrahydrofolate cyclo-ligase [Nocardioides marmoriginsengisoli]|uniref:5-formyltetrahydrofolate cyclo-ligase n=1 Tax=Nocardioides marmoriginsengisoli TaxID=661483 RepID=A0A3N0CG34_9ACTN|nr:5-formyltetrahydrofolate cyclo-ligase [Nocardioides marmoriginsengisoli]RNL62408.1 5-formyltetrahydrofolate cyclo-ligase [Nocardioides marmoriginsengisoli]
MEHIEAAKLALRDQLLTARGQLPVAELAARSRVIADLLLATDEVRRAATVAAYVSVGREPGTGILLDALLAAGKRVILPLLQPDNDLDWAPYAGPESLTRAGRGLLEPAGEPLGPDAIGTADVVIVPGLAVGSTGVRMGRGGGSYDRALGRVPVGTFVCVVLNESEVLADVPAAPHDRPVTAAVTEERLVRFG